MPDIRSKLGRYCIVHRYTHEDEYLVCDFCHEHRFSIYVHNRYYNYGFSRRSYCACNECHGALFDPYRIALEDDELQAYKSIIKVIKERTNNRDNKTIDYYEAVRIAYIENKHMQKYLNGTINDVREINKTFKPIWEFTYKISGGEEERIRLVNRDPDNLLVSWIPGERIYYE